VSAVVAAVDWGGTWLRAALARDGELLAWARQPRPAGFDSQCDLACDLVGRLGTELGQPARALAVGIAGVVRGGRVASASNLGLSTPVDLADRLRERCGIPVTVVNDTQAAAVAEAATLGPGTAVLLTVGTGVGGAIVSGGHLVLGEGAAGDFGHMVIDACGPVCACGGRGCLEQLVSGRVLDETARDLATTGASTWLAARLAERLAERLAAGGAAPEDVIKLNVWLRDMANRPVVNKYWLQMFPDEHSRPARHTFPTPDLRDPLLVECEIMAVISEKK